VAWQVSEPKHVVEVIVQIIVSLHKYLIQKNERRGEMKEGTLRCITDSSASTVASKALLGEVLPLSIE
jgi:hypothetical protein